MPGRGLKRVGQTVFIGTLVLAFMNPITVDDYINCGSVFRPESPWRLGPEDSLGYSDEVPVRSAAVSQACEEGRRNKSLLWVVTGAVGGLLWYQGNKRERLEES